MKANTYEYPDFDKFNTFPKLLKYRSEIMPDEVALRNKDLGIWNETSWKEYNQKVYNHILIYLLRTLNLCSNV